MSNNNTNIENTSIELEIKGIFDENKLSDLKRFLGKRQCLNIYNTYLIYLFHLLQSAGILTTTIAAGYDEKYLVWVGVGLNILASLVHVYEKTNNDLLKRLLGNIQAIKDGTYVDEGALIDVDKPPGDDTSNSNSSAYSPPSSSTDNSTSIKAPLI